jgi:Protein of unknown function (DUF433)
MRREEAISTLRSFLPAIQRDFAEGMTTEEILAAYPDLEREDIAGAPALRGRGCSRTGTAA